MRLTRAAGTLLAGSMLFGALGVGSLVFTSGFSEATPFGGTFSGGGDYVQTADDLRALMLGESFSVGSIIATDNAPTGEGVVFFSRLRWAPSTVNNNAVSFFDASGFQFNNQLNVAAGAATVTDYVVPRQNGIPITTGDADGTLFSCQASPGTCDAAHKGAAVCVTESATSATRLCRCIRTSDTGDFRWLNMDNATRGTTTTDCPDTAP